MAEPSELPHDSPIRTAMRKDLQEYIAKLKADMDPERFRRFYECRPLIDPPAK